MSIDEIERLMKKLVKEDYKSTKDRKSLSSKIKKLYKMKKQELKTEGKNFSYESLNRLVSILTENYERIKDNGIINEVMQEIAEDYSEIKPAKRISQEDISRRQMKIYQYILGNPGTKTDGMTSEFISDIIRLKLTEDDGINRDDILNILEMQSKNMYQDIEKYQKLINETIIAYFTYNPNGQNFTNPKVLKIFEKLADSYKISEEFDKVKEIYEQALEMKCLKDTSEYAYLKNQYKEFLEFLKMKGNFADRRFGSFERLMDELNKKFTEKNIFVQGQRGEKLNTESVSPTSNESNYVMPVDLRLKAFEILVDSLKEINEDYDITSCEIGKDSYDGYVIFKVKGTNIAIFENFNEVNARIFIVKKELIEQVRNLSRRDVIEIDGVEAVNHVSTFDNYCRNLKEKVLKLIGETSPKKEDEGIKFDKKETPVIPIIPSDMDENREDREKQSPDEKISEDEKEQSSDEISEDAEEQDSSIEEIKPLDPVEAERQKAHKNRESLRKLEAEIERIQKEAEEKIAKIKEQMANIKSGEEHK